jgi:hypothetical protein
MQVNGRLAGAPLQFDFLVRRPCDCLLRLPSAYIRLHPPACRLPFRIIADAHRQHMGSHQDSTYKSTPTTAYSLLLLIAETAQHRVPRGLVFFFLDAFRRTAVDHAHNSPRAVLLGDDHA